MNQLLGLLFGYAIGFAILWFGIKIAKRSIEASNWPSVPGAITKLYLRQDSDGDGSTTYKVEVEYLYSVMGQTYTSSRLAFGYSGMDSSRQAHQAILNKLEHAALVKVRYNPQNPAISTLSFGINRSIKIILLFAIGWLTPFLNFTLNSLIKTVVISNLITSVFSWVLISCILLSIWIIDRPDKVLLRNLEVISRKENYQ